ncbi:hypothetical protein ONS95_004358 [Cadophora gregata]|uniref:uncharacterized protein n=1 Tax=Cadophora gregata TaxID=51156 RepID=UPI0026DBA591|nr:uncharacterized protein ONS95_004358 [Cadophora gregata]KAK0105254.1 hypothetical protein ONS96_004651 [Cadophora gregata f. sp. sojae]KAK0105843.1 hypothetical protein ONS95_004358 [Cadophora gregata]
MTDEQVEIDRGGEGGNEGSTGQAERSPIRPVASTPAQDLGPKLALPAVSHGNGTFRNGYWFYGPWCGPISGAIFGWFLYDAAIFVGVESPVNYSRKRMARAWKKSRIEKKVRRGRRKVKFGGEKGGRIKMGDGAKL